MSTLEILPEDLIPGPPDESSDPVIQMAHLLDWSRKISTALIDYLNFVENSSTGLNNMTGSIFIGTVDSGADVTLAGAGLYLGQDKMGYYNGTSWTTVINNDGTFSFKIDASNEVSHDGTSLTIAATKGKIGSSTDYFDITNSKIQLRSSSTRFVHMTGDTISWRDTADGGGNARISIGFHTITISALSGANSATFNLEDKDGNAVFSCTTDGSTGDITAHVGEAAHGLHLSDFNTTWELVGIDLQTCTLASGSNTTIDASLVDSGTLPDARFPTDAVGVQTGSYTGPNPASDFAISLGIGNSAIYVDIKRELDTELNVIGVDDGSVMQCYRPGNSANPTGDTPIVKTSNGFKVLTGESLTDNVNAVDKKYYYTAFYALN